MENITDFLMNGRENAIPMSDLALMLNLPERTLRQEILNARLKGELIVSNDQGYFLPSCQEDLKEYVNIRKARIRTSLQALRPFIKAIR